MQKIYFLALMMFASFAVYSQGTIAGNVKDTKTGEAVIGANVVIQGTTQGSATDVEGNFIINNVKEGIYALQVSSVTYKTHTIPNVVVETAKKITINIALHEDVSELEEVVVQGTRQTDTDFDLLKSIKEARVVVVGITSEQISKSLDRDAAQVLRRVPGITIRGDQFVQVRGLSERYNPVMLHNAFAPSVETDVRSFSFQTIPSSQLERMLVFKSPAADLPGDFAGGVVKIFTRSVPEENSIIVDYSTQVRAGTTFNDYYSQERNTGHFTGFNTRFYNLPSDFPADASTGSGVPLETAGKSMKNLWIPQKGTAIPDQRFTLTFNRKFKIGKIEVGNISAINYSNSFSTFDVFREDWTQTTGTTEQNFSYSDKQYNQQVRTGFLFNWAFKFNPNNTIEFKNLFNQSSNDQFVNRMGLGVSEGQKNAGYDKVYRGIYSGQLLGTHDLFNKRTTLEWLAGYNSSTRDQPDYKRYRSQINGGTGLATIIVPNTVTPDLLGRFFAALDESAYTGGLSIKQRFDFGNSPLNSPEIKAGVFFENKTRSFNARNIGYIKGFNFDNSLISLPIGELFQPQNINNSTGIKLSELTKRQDSYSASNSLLAYYLMATIPFGQKLKLDAGVRFENNLQKLKSYDNLKDENVDISNQVNRILPSANLSYNFTEKMLVRAAYGETLNRPEFRELAPFAFFDFNFNYLFNGNAGLKTAKIQNLDVRWEYYPSRAELITIGAFYKNFDDPIESFVDSNTGGGGGGKNVGFQNAQYAKVFGVEVEIKKSLSGISSSRFLNNLNVLFNATVISSTIKVPSALAVNRESERPLQGQAPYVINAGAFYNSEASGWTVNLLYNVVGKNITFVGNDTYPDVYLMPRNLFDITFTKRISERFIFKGGITDILNEPIRLQQNGATLTTRVVDYKPGQVVSLGFSYRF